MSPKPKSFIQLLPSLFFLALFVWMIWPWLFSGEVLVISVVPGSHNIIIPPYFIGALVIEAATLMNALGYFLIYRKYKRVSRKMFVWHLFMFLPVYVLLFENWIIWESAPSNYNSFLTFIEVFAIVSVVSFAVIQVVFLYHVIYNLLNDENIEVL